ncbi:MAG TPA: hypothetical protein IGS37_05455 [Synechococcales cyanobacterium M55_K2018_004]|nr:hypothetical protein [Synechococcales cyanobacterium M55_K2018_004]
MLHTDQFQPTHYLVSRTRKTPVQLVMSEQGCKLLTAQEFEQGKEPAFELRSRQGVFCQGVLVVGYSLEPMGVVKADEAVASTVQ